MAQQEMRVLLAWCDREEAVQFQLGSRVPNPDELLRDLAEDADEATR